MSNKTFQEVVAEYHADNEEALTMRFMRQDPSAMAIKFMVLGAEAFYALVEDHRELFGSEARLDAQMAAFTQAIPAFQAQYDGIVALAPRAMGTSMIGDQVVGLILSSSTLDMGALIDYELKLTQVAAANAAATRDERLARLLRSLLPDKPDVLTMGWFTTELRSFLRR